MAGVGDQLGTIFGKGIAKVEKMIVVSALVFQSFAFLCALLTTVATGIVFSGHPSVHLLLKKHQTRELFQSDILKFSRRRSVIAFRAELSGLLPSYFFISRSGIN